MDVPWAKDVKVDTNLLLGVGGIILALVSFVLSRRAEKLVGIPVMTGYGSNHEKAMMEGTLKVSVTTNILMSTSSLNPTFCSTPQLPLLSRPNDPL